MPGLFLFFLPSRKLFSAGIHDADNDQDSYDCESNDNPCLNHRSRDCPYDKDCKKSK